MRVIQRCVKSRGLRNIAANLLRWPASVLSISDALWRSILGMEPLSIARTVELTRA